MTRIEPYDSGMRNLKAYEQVLTPAACPFGGSARVARPMRCRMRNRSRSEVRARKARNIAAHPDHKLLVDMPSSVHQARAPRDGDSETPPDPVFTIILRVAAAKEHGLSWDRGAVVASRKRRTCIAFPMRWACAKLVRT